MTHENTPGRAPFAPTPGPWLWSFLRLNPKKSPFRVGLKGKNGDIVADVVRADYDDHYDDHEIDIDNESDARLIAYAPLLYEAAARLARARTLAEQTAAWEGVVKVVREVEGGE